MENVVTEAATSPTPLRALLMAVQETSLLELIKGGFLVLGGGVITAIVTAWFQRKKTNAETESTLSGATMDFAKLLQSDLLNLRGRVVEAEGKYETALSDLKKTKEDLLKAEGQVRELTAIIEISKERDAKNQELIVRLSEALKQYAPENPILATLAAAATMPKKP